MGWPLKPRSLKGDISCSPLLKGGCLLLSEDAYPGSWAAILWGSTSHTVECDMRWPGWYLQLSSAWLSGNSWPQPPDRWLTELTLVPAFESSNQGLRCGAETKPTSLCPVWISLPQKLGGKKWSLVFEASKFWDTSLYWDFIIYYIEIYYWHILYYTALCNKYCGFSEMINSKNRLGVFIQTVIPIEHILCAWLCTRDWGYSGE